MPNDSDDTNDEEHRDVELGRMARFLATQNGVFVSAALVMLGAALFFGLAIWVMNTCPRASEGLCWPDVR